MESLPRIFIGPGLFLFKRFCAGSQINGTAIKDMLKKQGLECKSQRRVQGAHYCRGGADPLVQQLFDDQKG